jgi:hypothetical protein
MALTQAIDASSDLVLCKGDKVLSVVSIQQMQQAPVVLKGEIQLTVVEAAACPVVQDLDEDRDRRTSVGPR